MLEITNKLNAAFFHFVKSLHNSNNIILANNCIFSRNLLVEITSLEHNCAQSYILDKFVKISQILIIKNLKYKKYLQATAKAHTK